MRILMTVHGYKPADELGGPVAVVAAAAEGLVQRGHEIVVCATNAGIEGDSDVPLDQKIDVNGAQVWYFRRREPFRAVRLAPYLSKSAGFMYAPAMARRVQEL